MSWSAPLPIPTALARLEAGMAYRLVLILAPQGAGKTRLLRQWAAWRIDNGLRPPGWASLTEQDNSFPVFLPHLVSAVAGIDHEFQRWMRLTPKGPRLLHAAQPPLLLSTSAEVELIDLNNTLAQAPDELALILDEYHRIHAPEIHQAVAFLLEYLPPPVHLYLAARRQPPLRLAHLRARREMIEINPGELSTDSE